MALIPPDTEQCQAEVVDRTPFALGGTHKRTRCSNKPDVIATEVRAGKDGQTGSMSLCLDCQRELIKQLGCDFAFVPCHTGD